VNPHRREVKGDSLVVTFDGVGAGWEQWILVTSDRHWDSKHSDRAMQKRHLDEAVERDALVMDLGDLFDGMQGRNDRRGDKSSLRPEHQTADYFTSLVDTATEWFAPYAENIIMLGTGNHESAIVRHNEINLTWHLARQLNAMHGGDIHQGRYSGYVKCQFRAPGPRTYRPSILAYYHHGSGGASPVTKGVIGTNRRAVFLPDPHVVLTGHSHQTWQVPITRERVNDGGAVFMDTQMHISVPSYKMEPRREGYAAEKGYAPTEKGAIWWRLYYRAMAVHSEWTWAR